MERHVFLRDRAPKGWAARHVALAYQFRRVTDRDSLVDTADGPSMGLRGVWKDVGRASHPEIPTEFEREHFGGQIVDGHTAQRE